MKQLPKQVKIKYLDKSIELNLVEQFYDYGYGSDKFLRDKTSTFQLSRLLYGGTIAEWHISYNLGNGLFYAGHGKTPQKACDDLLKNMRKDCSALRKALNV